MKGWCASKERKKKWGPPSHPRTVLLHVFHDSSQVQVLIKPLDRGDTFPKKDTQQGQEEKRVVVGWEWGSQGRQEAGWGEEMEKEEEVKQASAGGAPVPWEKRGG